LLHFLLGTLVFFLLNYFGWSDDRTEHEVVPSLLHAMFGAVFLGVGMTAYYEWMDRRAERE
jgi:dsRNA-specific ribonuclease